MKIFTVIHDKMDHDSYLGHVVAAYSESQVRLLAKNIAAGEGKDIWDEAEVTCCGEYTCHRKEPFIIMSDFRNG